MDNDKLDSFIIIIGILKKAIKMLEFLSKEASLENKIKIAVFTEESNRELDKVILLLGL